MKTSNYKDSTKAAHLGRDTKTSSGFVNLPVYHGSTVLYESIEHLREVASSKNTSGLVTYGRRGTPASFALEEAIADMEGAYAAINTTSGLAAITCSLLAFLKTGDHILVPDSVYQPTRNFCDSMLKKFGVSTTYYDPLIGGRIAEVIQPNTTVIFLESPGSNTFEIQDVPAIAEKAKQRQIVTIIDNTWGTPVYFKPFELGVDVSVHAATKYITGHADAMLGIISANEQCYPLVKSCVHSLGECAGPDTIFLGLRGLRTLPTRLRHHHVSGLKIANWLKEHPEVKQIMHPALPGDPGYEIWSRDFGGACGLFGFILNEESETAAIKFVNSLKLFGKGFSWGGFESLLIPTNPAATRTATKWENSGVSMRIHVGLEDPDDLIADLQSGFDAMRKFKR